MALSREDLRSYVRACDPSRPLMAEDPRYVPLDDMRGRDGLSCIEIIEKNISLLDESCQLFTGFLGTGKTTELRQLEARLNASRDLPTHVVYVNFEDWIDTYSSLSIADVLRVIAYCLDREATRAEGDDPDRRPGYLKRLYDFVVETDIEWKKAEFSAWGASFMMELKNNRDFYRRAEAALMSRFQQFADEARESMESAVQRLRKARGAHAERVVVIADGLEKITPLRDEDREQVEASVEGVFISHARLLHMPCHVVYTFPLWLRYRRVDLGSSYDGEPLVLPMIKIAGQDGAPVPRGLELLTEMIGRRIDIPRVFGPRPEETLRPLLDASGGYARDLIRMARSLLMSARAFPVSAADSARVVDLLAEDYGRALFATDVDVLVKVAETHALPRDNRGALSSFARLLDRWFVLAYRNGVEWYDLHPLIRRDPLIAAHLRTAGR